MKELASALALATILLFPIVLALTLPVLGSNAASAQTVEGEPLGQTLFIAQKCSTCHSIESLGIEATTKSERMQASDLSAVGAKHDAPFLTKFLRKEEKVEGEEHRSSWRGTDQELEELAAWLAALKPSR